jgi:hypothetical protein
MLFQKIMAVSYKFHDNEWKDISVQAKGARAIRSCVWLMRVHACRLHSSSAGRATDAAQQRASGVLLVSLLSCAIGAKACQRIAV